MHIENSFTVPLTLDQAWITLLDIRRVAECMPGAVLDSADGDIFAGRVKVKVGPVSLTYKGQAEITQRDEAKHVAMLVAKGRDARGNGTAGANVTMRLADDGGRTRVDLLTELDITGRPAQMGRGVMTEVSNRLINQFADALAGKLAAEQTAGATVAPNPDALSAPASEPAASVPRHAAPMRTTPPSPAAAEINVLSLAGRSIVRRMWTGFVRLLGRLLGHR
ncbi:carbon monoxide dehydrogenase [Nonomuraea phyllanthi]|uniref:Carbon monoxide dehydrogenase n=1 Tax=Nonomuraea phyllanthi TaxID=2219224 RepID=A0A5C4VJ32_9ACTN|nr:SRPBCC family protein [Nonomuraea phyllanthi]KAB8189130.1 carbon monoxide dehydrogenase [Nonomuraea phyllanthi]